VLNRRARRKLYLTTPPGSIAAIVSLTSRSGFGDLLLPYDDQQKISRKLQGLRFGLDARTGAIVADDAAVGVSTLMRDDSMMTLLDRSHPRLSSSATALERNNKPVDLVVDLYNPFDPPASR